MFDLSCVDDLQKTLYAGFQIVVLSAGHGNAVISRSPPAKTDGMREIVVYHNTDHYDLITSLDGFLMSGKYCEHCEKSYSNKRDITAKALVPIVSEQVTNVSCQ